MAEMEEQVHIFSLDEELEAFIRIADDCDDPNENLDSRSVYLVVDPKNKVAWIWNGGEAKVREKFIATLKAPLIRDEHCVDFKIIGIDEDNEPPEFKSFLGVK